MKKEDTYSSFAESSHLSPWAWPVQGSKKKPPTQTTQFGLSSSISNCLMKRCKMQGNRQRFHC